MTSVVRHVVEAKRAVQYDGANADEIIALIGHMTTLEEDRIGNFDATWKFESRGRELTAKMDDWIIFWQNTVVAVLGPVDMPTFYDLTDPDPPI